MPELDARLLIIGIPIRRWIASLPEYNRIHYNTALQWCQNGTLPARKVGRRWLILPDGAVLPSEAEPEYTPAAQKVINGE